MGKVAFVFAGQGAQNVGMGRDLYRRFDSVRQLFDAHEEVRELCFRGPNKQLFQTQNAQLALFLTDIACATVLTENGIAAEGVAGFSLGEIPAACYAGLLETAQGFALVRRRAGAMQACAEKHSGAMFAVLKLSVGEVEDICTTLPHAYPANYNCSEQTVVACAESTAGTLRQRVEEAGGKTIRLAVSGAFHSPFMDAASESVGLYLERESLGEMRIPLYANATARVYEYPRETLALQINRPVMWQKTIENMVEDGYDVFVEVGPGTTLSRLIKKINPNVLTLNISDSQSLERTVEELRHA